MEARLQAVKRGDRGKNAARRLRAAGRLPAVVYGSAGDGGRPVATAVSVEPKALTRILRSQSGANTLIGLEVDGENAVRVLVKDYQLDPVSQQLLHADFFRIAMDQAITVTVPVVLRGEAKGVKQQGGLLEFVNRQVEIECLPGEIPEHLDVDVTELLVDQSVRMRDLATGAPWTAVTDPDTMILHVVAPRATEEAGAGADATTPTTAEPEVIKKGKAEKGEE
jgi:large subunit ribosomal protein L25